MTVSHMSTSKLTAASLHRRHAVEKRFRAYGVVAIVTALVFLIILLSSMLSKGYSAFFQAQIRLPVFFSQDVIDPKRTNSSEIIARANYQILVRNALKARFPDVKKRHEVKKLTMLISRGARRHLRAMVAHEPSLIGTTQEVWLLASGDADMFLKGAIPRDIPEKSRRINDRQIAWLNALEEDGASRRRFNVNFFTAGDSREAEQAGIWGAIVGSALTLIVTLILSFPVSVTAAVYLEELSTKNWWTDFLEVNINNMAAVPSIIYGLFGLAIFLNVMHLPRSAPVVGGIVLALMTFPTIIIATRASLKAVPPSIREAARGLGASPAQVVLHHVLPLAMPGIFTGTIIGMSRALGESAPLLMIGMVAFIVDIPQGLFDPASVLPVQIYLWADSPERAFVEKTAAATLVLMVFLVVMNATAVILRRKFEKRW
ncbi:MAG: phosphate ABC transporter permease PstA [Alphaproteobacteria bacterium]|nr:phosphate ABC transporter permease PstA [Alphaproteobacteria bacterium]